MKAGPKHVWSSILRMLHVRFCQLRIFNKLGKNLFWSISPLFLKNRIRKAWLVFNDTDIPKPTLLSRWQHYYLKSSFSLVHVMKCFLVSAKTCEDEDRGQRMWEPSERVLIGIPGIERKCFAMVGLFCWALTIDGSGSLADHGDSLLRKPSHWEAFKLISIPKNSS